jgi:hypothetical protein
LKWIFTKEGVTVWNECSLKMGAVGCPETSIRIYLYSLRNNPEERSLQLLRGSYDNELHYLGFTVPLLWESDTGLH